MKLSTENLTKIALVAAAYVALTLALTPYSFGIVQFRFSEILNLLAFFNPIYILAVSLGCFIANLLSPIGFFDLIFGTLHTLISLLVMWKIKKILPASLTPAIFSFIVVIGLILAGIPNLAFLPTYFSIALSEFIICTLISLPLYYLMYKNPSLRRFLSQGSRGKDLSPAIWPKLLTNK